MRLGDYPIETHIVVLDQRADASQARLEGWKRVRRFLRDVQQHLDNIDEPLLLGCGLSTGSKCGSSSQVSHKNLVPLVSRHLMEVVFEGCQT